MQQSGRFPRQRSTIRAPCSAELYESVYSKQPHTLWSPAGAQAPALTSRSGAPFWKLPSESQCADSHWACCSNKDSPCYCSPHDGTPRYCQNQCGSCNAACTAALHQRVHRLERWLQQHWLREIVLLLGVLIAVLVVTVISVETIPGSRITVHDAVDSRRTTAAVLAFFDFVMLLYAVAVWQHLVPTIHTYRAIRTIVHMLGLVCFIQVLRASGYVPMYRCAECVGVGGDPEPTFSVWIHAGIPTLHVIIPTLVFYFGEVSGMPAIWFLPVLIVSTSITVLHAFMPHVLADVKQNDRADQRVAAFLANLISNIPILWILWVAATHSTLKRLHQQHLITQFLASWVVGLTVCLVAFGTVLDQAYDNDTLANTTVWQQDAILHLVDFLYLFVIGMLAVWSAHALSMYEAHTALQADQVADMQRFTRWLFHKMRTPLANILLATDDTLEMFRRGKFSATTADHGASAQLHSGADSRAWTQLESGHAEGGSRVGSGFSSNARSRSLLSTSTLALSQDGINLAAEAADLLTTATAACRDMTRLLDTVKQLEVVTGPQGVMLERVPVDIVALYRSVVTECRDRASGVGVLLEASKLIPWEDNASNPLSPTPAPSPEIPQELWVLADWHKLQFAMRTMVMNAVQYASHAVPSQGQPARVVVRLMEVAPPAALSGPAASSGLSGARSTSVGHSDTQSPIAPEDVTLNTFNIQGLVRGEARPRLASDDNLAAATGLQLPGSAISRRYLDLPRKATKDATTAPAAHSLSPLVSAATPATQQTASLQTSTPSASVSSAMTPREGPESPQRPRSRQLSALAKNTATTGFAPSLAAAEAGGVSAAHHTANATVQPPPAPTNKDPRAQRVSRRRLCFMVSDNGPGMDEAALQLMFTPFAFLSTSSGGTGLSLAITQSFVKHHGGRCSAFSLGPEMGTEVGFELPLIQVTRPRHIHQPTHSTASGGHAYPPLDSSRSRSSRGSQHSKSPRTVLPPALPAPAQQQSPMASPAGAGPLPQRRASSPGSSTIVNARAQAGTQTLGTGSANTPSWTLQGSTSVPIAATPLHTDAGSSVTRVPGAQPGANTGAAVVSLLPHTQSTASGSVQPTQSGRFTGPSGTCSDARTLDRVSGVDRERAQQPRTLTRRQSSGSSVNSDRSAISLDDEIEHMVGMDSGDLAPAGIIAVTRRTHNRARHRPATFRQTSVRAQVADLGRARRSVPCPGGEPAAGAGLLNSTEFQGPPRSASAAPPPEPPPARRTSTTPLPQRKAHLAALPAPEPTPQAAQFGLRPQQIPSIETAAHTADRAHHIQDSPAPIAPLTLHEHADFASTGNASEQSLALSTAGEEHGSSTATAIAPSILLAKPAHAFQASSTGMAHAPSYLLGRDVGASVAFKQAIPAPAESVGVRAAMGVPTNAPVGGRPPTARKRPVVEIASPNGTRSRSDAASAAERQAAAPPRPAQRYALVVDDVTATRKLVARQLKKAKVGITKILEAGDGREAVEIVQSFMRQSSVSAGAAAGTAPDPKHTAEYDPDACPICVITMDMEMPVMRGDEATALIREMGFAGGIIALTGNALQKDINRMRNAGTDRVCTKPVDAAVLQGTVRALLRELENDSSGSDGRQGSGNRLE